MFVKLAIASLLALATAAPQHQQPAQYPAGVSPALCPGFPICDNALLHNPQPHWNAQPHHAPAHHSHWNPPAPQHNHLEDDGQYHWSEHNQHNDWNAQPQHSHWNQPALHGPASNHVGHDGGAAEKYPAGVNPHTCPNYPFCDVNGGHNHGHAAAPLPGFTERLYPAGVSPHSCPNFPYCN